MKVTRRSLVGTVAALAAGSAIRVSQPASAQTPETAASPTVAHRQFQQAAQQLAAFKLPRNIEPAMRFEA